MGRKRRRRHAGKSSGGAMTSLRGGFQAAARSVTGTGPARPTSRGRSVVSNLITVLAVAALVVVLLRKFGVLGH